MKLIRLVPLFVIAVAACSSRAPAVAPQSGTTVPAAFLAASAQDRAKAEAEYVALLARVKKDPLPADVKRLRELYVRTDRYQPYGADHIASDTMFDDMDAKRWEQCRASAGKTLERNYIDMNAHFGLMVCNREDGRRTEAAHHEAMLRGVIEAILASGDGKSMETAFVTYYTPEIYAFLGVNGLQSLGQALADEDGQWFDIMTVKDRETGKQRSLYFNITWQWTKQALDDSRQEPAATP
jgi:hypothetical protein